MATPSLSSKSCADLEIRLSNISSIESAQVSASNNSQWLQHTGKASLSHRLRRRYAQKRGYLPSQGMHNSRFLQQIVSCTKTREKMAPSNRLKCTEQLSAGSDFQDGDCRDHPKFAYKRGMAGVHRSQRCVLSCSHTPGLSSFASLPCGQANVPVQSSAIRASNSTSRVHANRTRSKACSSVSRNSYSPVSRRLVVKTKYQPPMSFTDKRTHSGGTRSRLCDKLRKVRARTYTKNRLSGLQFRFDSGKSLSNRKEVENSRKSCSRHGGRITNNPKVAYVPDRCTSIPRKDNTNGQAPHASVSVVPEDTLAISPVSRPEDSGFKSSEKLSSVVEKSQKSRKGLSFTSSGTQYPYFHRCVKPGLGSSFRKSDSQWQLDRSGKIASYQCPRVKGGVSGLKKLSKQYPRQEGSYSNRQRHCSQLSEQTRGNTLVGHVSPGLAHHGLLQSSKHTHKSQTHSGLPQCHSRQSLQEGQNNSDRVVTSSSNIHLNLPSLAQTNGRHVCHKLPIYVSPLPDANAMNIDALNISWEGLDGYAYCPVALIPKVIQKMNTYRCRMIVVAPGWPRMHWFWDLVNLSTKPPLQLPHWPHLLKQPFSQKFHQNLMYLNLHVWHLDTTQNHLNHSLSRWQIELRHLKDPHLEDYMSQGGPFLNSGANRIRWSAQSLLSQT